MMPMDPSDSRTSPAWRRHRSSLDRGIMWLMFVGSPLSGWANRHSPAYACWRSNIAARLSAPPRNLGCAVTSSILSPSTQISRFVLRSPSRNCDPVRAPMPLPPLSSWNDNVDVELDEHVGHREP